MERTEGNSRILYFLIRIREITLRGNTRRNKGVQFLHATLTLRERGKTLARLRERERERIQMKSNARKNVKIILKKISKIGSNAHFKHLDKFLIPCNISLRRDIFYEIIRFI